jgi:HSP20 family protein
MSYHARRRDTSPVTRELWDPFWEFADLRQGMTQLMGTVSSTGIAGDDPWSPLVDIDEDDDAWTVEADLPGVKKDDVHVELTDGELAISGEVKRREDNSVRRRRTRHTGRFEYRVTLPGKASADDIDASLENGVLTVRVPKSAQAKPRQFGGVLRLRNLWLHIQRRTQWSPSRSNARS